MPFPIELHYILAAEQELGCTFPESFKEHMMKLNGGELVTDDDDWELFPFFDKSDKKRMSRTSNHIVKETIEARKWQSFPADAIAIATNGAGDYLLFLPLATDSITLDENIYVWHHDNGLIEKMARSIDELR